MTAKSTAMLRILTGQGLVPRPGWMERILTMFDLRKTRIDLSRLTDEQLHDIGLTRDEVEEELSRRMWDVPPNWRRH
ncbi:DUF1127 domain-containing protein [Paracoccus sp. (in: a-proteobacteria)]|uniref:DUF1127 domain-containing protein n=1 Tax=Paracoccus sp. TaxID=267 RepID=UPI003A850FED